MKIELKVKLDWHIVEAIENEARTNAIYAVGDPDIFVEELVNHAVTSWVGRNVPDYFDESALEIRAIETEVLEEIYFGEGKRLANYPEWYGRENGQERVRALREIAKRLASP